LKAFSTLVRRGQKKKVREKINKTDRNQERKKERNVPEIVKRKK
jgi:hypothetical protein